jgi:hypothetical protein
LIERRLPDASILLYICDWSERPLVRRSLVAQSKVATTQRVRFEQSARARELLQNLRALRQQFARCLSLENLLRAMSRLPGQRPSIMTMHADSDREDASYSGKGNAR